VKAVRTRCGRLVTGGARSEPSLSEILPDGPALSSLGSVSGRLPPRTDVQHTNMPTISGLSAKARVLPSGRLDNNQDSCYQVATSSQMLC
jgi:hypothetical protein